MISEISKGSLIRVFAFACLLIQSSSAFAIKPKVEALTLKTQPSVETPFIVHAENKPLGSYLAINLDFTPFDELRVLIEKKLGHPLKNRGEAHITVISPVEFDSILKNKLSMEKINSMALRSHIQKADMEFICVGRGSLRKNGKLLETYYVVVKSEKVLALRKEIEEEFIRLGGNPESFRALSVSPHVTLGFSDRDLHLEDGIKKDINSCVYPLKMAK